MGQDVGEQDSHGDPLHCTAKRIGRLSFPPRNRAEKNDFAENRGTREISEVEEVTRVQAPSLAIPQERSAGDVN